MGGNRILITGGLGFIGTNLAVSLLESGMLENRGEIVILDNYSRPGTRLNQRYLLEHRRAHRITIVNGDVRNMRLVHEIMPGINAVFHLAAQVAVTTSVQSPLDDFQVNAHGTLNVLEAARTQKAPPLIVFPSTNKVYGGLEDLTFEEKETRYACPDLPNGVPECQPLDFHSPYGCSKGAADQYVRDYARIYAVPSVVLRLSCVFGPRQFGIGDQGWVGWFIAKAMLGKSIAIFGNGKQVRDLLYVPDLCDLFMKILENRDKVVGKVFNVGGGPANSLSIWKEFSPLLEGLFEREIPATYHDWRPGDQKYYVSDISRIRSTLAWSPATKVKSAVSALFEWTKLNEQVLLAPELGGAY